MDIRVLMPKIDFFLFLSGSIVKICTFAVRIAGKGARGHQQLKVNNNGRYHYCGRYARGGLFAQPYR